VSGCIADRPDDDDWLPTSLSGCVSPLVSRRLDGDFREAEIDVNVKDKPGKTIQSMSAGVGGKGWLRGTRMGAGRGGWSSGES